MFVSFQAPVSQAKILLVLGGNFSSSAKDPQPEVVDSRLDQSWILNMLWKDNPLHVRAAFPRLRSWTWGRKESCWQRPGFFFLWRDWKDMLILSYTKR